MKKTAATIMIITILSKLFGFLREVTLSYFYGASQTSDAYLIALTIPNVIFAFIGAGIATTYIPLYSNIMQEKGTQNADRFTNNIVNFVLILCTLIILIGMIFTVPIVKMFASGFVGETLQVSVFFTRITLIGIYFSGLIYILSGYLQIKNNYIIPALIGFPSNFIIVTSIALSPNYGSVILAAGSVIATASQVLLLIPFAYKKGYRYSFVLDRKDEYLKKMLYLSFPIIISASVNQINVLVDRTIASQIVEGGISALNYANKLILFVHGIIAMSIATVMYPMISKMAAEKNMDKLKNLLSESISAINLFIIPAAIGAMVFAQPIVELLFGRGAFDYQAVSLTSYALLFYSIGMVGFGLREVLSRVFYSMQDTKTPMINASIAVGMNIILNIILSRFWGIGGLALATSISALFCTLLLFISLRKKIGHFGLKQISISSAKIVFSAIAMGIAAKRCYDILLTQFSTNLSLVISMVTGVAIYFIFIYLLKVKEVRDIIAVAKQEIKRITA